MMWTVHVDDILLAAGPRQLQTAHANMEARFGQMETQSFPFKHIGMQYERLSNGSIFVHQREFFLAFRAATNADGRRHLGQ